MIHKHVSAVSVRGARSAVVTLILVACRDRPMGPSITGSLWCNDDGHVQGATVGDQQTNLLPHLNHHQETGAQDDNARAAKQPMGLQLAANDGAPS